MITVMGRILVLSICLVFGFACADENVEKANAYIDEFIARATNESGGFVDPLPLEDLNKTFEKKVGFVDIKGEAKLYGGKIVGLSSFRRVGNALVIDLDDVIMIACSMSFRKVKADYDGSLIVNSFGPKVKLHAAVGSSNISMAFIVPSEGGNATLLSFNINSLTDIRVSVSGLGPWGWAASIMSSLALNALEKPVAKAASIKMFEVFSKEIEKVPYPG